MPAHNAMLGIGAAAAIGATLYTVHQRREVEREDRNAREEFDKLNSEAVERRERQREKDGIEAEMRADVNYEMSRAKEEILVADLLRDVYNLAKQRQHACGKTSIDLPLIDYPGRPDSPIEVAMGVGLVLGLDGVRLTRIIEQLDTQGIGALGVAAGSLTHETLHALSALLDKPPSLGIQEDHLRGLDKETTAAFLRLTYYRPPSDEAQCTILTHVSTIESCRLRALAQHLGLSIYPWSWLDMSRRLKNTRRPELGGSAYAKPRYQGTLPTFPDGELLLATFSIADGPFQFRLSEARDDGHYAFLRKDPIVDSGRVLPRNVTKASLFLAQIKVYRLAREGGARLHEIANKVSNAPAALYLKKGPTSTAPPKARGVPLEHLAALSGELSVIETDLLRELREHDRSMIEEHSDKVLTELRRGLRHLLCKDGPSHAQGTEGGEEETNEELEAQINGFTADYLSLVKIRIALVPRLSNGAPPHEYVHAKPITIAAHEHFMLVPKMPHWRRATDVITLGEHEREVIVRTLGTLPTTFTFCCTHVPFLVFTWINCMVFEALGVRAGLLSEWTLEQPWHWHPWHALVFIGIFGIGFGYWCVYALLQLARSQKCCDLTAADSIRETQRRLCFAFFAWLARRLGWAQPLERIILPLEQRCQAVLGVWRGRLARRQFYEALHRGRIGAHVAMLLLEDLCAARQARRDERQHHSTRQRGSWQFFKMRRQRTHQPKATRARRPKPREANIAHVERAPVSNMQGRGRGRGGRGRRLGTGVVYDTPSNPLPTRSFKSDAELQEEEEEEDAVCDDVTAAAHADKLDEGSVIDEVVLPGTIAEAEAFLELAVEESQEDETEGVPAEVPVAKLLHVFQDAFQRRMAPADAVQSADAQHRLKDNSAAQTRRARKVSDVVRENGWTLVRSKKHLVFKRTVGGRRQTYVASKTPSDRRATKNQLHLLDTIENDLDRNLRPPRFPIGARVECFVGCEGEEEDEDCWECGTVMQHHYYEEARMMFPAPYQVRLDSDHGLIFATRDDDRCIRLCGEQRDQALRHSTGGATNTRKKSKGGKKGGKHR